MLFFKKVFGKLLRKTNNALSRMGIEDTNWTLFSWKSFLSKLDLKVDVCFFGDSITRGGNFHKFFKNKKVCNLGISGDGLVGMNGRVDMIASVCPEYVFVMAGINDICSRRKPEKCIALYRLLIEKIRDQLPDTRIFVQSILPINTRMRKSLVKNDAIAYYNGLLVTMCDELNIEYVDLYSVYALNGELPEEYTVDGLHIKEEFYCLWYDKIKIYLETE